MTSPGAVVLLLMAATALLSGCGGAASVGSVVVELRDSGTPNPPDITTPANTDRFRLEVLNPNGSERVLPSKDVDYDGSATVRVEMEDVPEGSWVVRLSALDGAGYSVAWFQEPAEVSGGSEVRLQGWLRPGAAPEGLLFVANSGVASMSIVRLTDGHVEDLPLPENPQHLFTDRGKIYSTTRSAQLMVVEGVNRSIQMLSMPAMGEFARAGTTGVISFPSEGGIRFLDTNTESFATFLRTGNGASGLSRQVGPTIWVANPGDNSLTQVDVVNQALGPNVALGAPGSQLDQNTGGSRVYVIGGGPSGSGTPFVRVVEPSGGLVANFTDRLEAPAGVLVEGDRAYVTDSARGELIIYDDEVSPVEVERVRIGEGGPSQMISDGDRLYVAMQSSGEVAVVDLDTRSLVTRYRVGASPKGMAHLR